MADNNVKQDLILSSLNLKRKMVYTDSMGSFYDEKLFTRYVTKEYLNSSLRDTDEVYNMFQFCLLHKESGLRLNLTSYENYNGDTVVYKVIGLFVMTSSKNNIEVLDANFENRIFITDQGEIPFSQCNLKT
jgi:hypothetical protein